MVPIKSKTDGYAAGGQAAGRKANWPTGAQSGDGPWTGPDGTAPGATVVQERRITSRRSIAPDSEAKKTGIAPDSGQAQTLFTYESRHAQKNLSGHLLIFLSAVLTRHGGG